MIRRKYINELKKQSETLQSQLNQIQETIISILKDKQSITTDDSKIIIKNLKNGLLLNSPYQFKDICTIYPISIEYALSFDTNAEFLNKFMPYMITKEVLSEELPKDISIFEIICLNEQLFINLADTIMEICKTENIKMNTETLEIFINDSTSSLNKDNFEEFSELVLEMIQAKKLTKAENKEPEFATEEGRQRWLQLQKNREAFNKKSGKDEAKQLYDIINIVQFGLGTYIPDNEILSWSYWKLIKSYMTVLNKTNYQNSFDVYLQTGDKSLIETHWSELIKL